MNLQVAVEDWISSLPDEEFAALCARTRPPDEPVPERRPVFADAGSR